MRCLCKGSSDAWYQRYDGIEGRLMTKKKSLTEMEKSLLSKLTPTKKAQKLADRVCEIVTELDWMAKRIAESMKNPNSLLEMTRMYQYDLKEIAEMLRILEQEQFRQREAIKLFLHRREGESFLRLVSESWNNDPVKEN